jgi:hypothetical protein
MRWKEKPLVQMSRTRRRFLFLPLKIGDETRWLELAEWLEIDMGIKMWVKIAWATDDDRVNGE